MLYIVTVRLGKNSAHNPREKVTGECPYDGERCTDTTGEHHSFLVDSLLSLGEVKKNFETDHHVTRVEVAQNLVVI